jgi:lysophospholipase L1-like esterase
MKLKPILFLAVIWGILFALVEAGSWLVLKVANARHPSDNPLVNEYIARGHPLFSDNDDLRVRNQEFFFHPFLGYEQAREHVTVRPHAEYTGRIEVDAAGFVHTGDPRRNPERLLRPKGNSYRVAFIGGSTMFGLGASGNQGTIPAYFEALLRQRWPGVDFLVLNAGVQGYQSTQERVAYQLYLDPLEPDLVVAMDGFNDAIPIADLPTWAPHYSSTTILDQLYFVALHKPSVNFASAIRALATFPEPLASLALLRRVISRLPTPPPSNQVRSATYHPEAMEQLRDNLDALARQIRADKRLGLFVLQPYLGHAKANLTQDEHDLITGYGDRISVFNRHFDDFEALYLDLGRHHAGSGNHFANFRPLFTDTKGPIYHSIAHYNDRGNRMIAEAMMATIEPALTTDLKTRGLTP